jgi:type I restriction enzyme R subunit
VREARNQREETGLTPVEIAFYDALAEYQSAVDILGNDQLKVIAHELLKGLKANVMA